MQIQKRFKLFITFVPLIILILMSAYFSKESWDEYQKNRLFKNRLENIEILQKYETAILNETLCKLLAAKEAKNVSDNCNKHIEKSISLLDILSKKSQNLSPWVNEISQIQKNSSKYDISNIEKLLGKENLISEVTLYINSIKKNVDTIEKRNLLQIHGKLVNILYATNLEKLLLTYYLSKDTPIPTSNIIFWDKIIEASYLIDFQDNSYIPSVKNELIKISNNPKSQINLSKIDELRIQILTNNRIKNSGDLNWTKEIEKKYSMIKKQSSIISNALYEKADTSLHTTLIHLLSYLSILLLGIISLLYTYRYHNKNSVKNSLLDKCVNTIISLENDNNEKLEALKKKLHNAKSKEDISIHIYEYIQHLHTRCNNAEEEAKLKSNFLSTLSHEIRTPLNGIIGFSKLLKDIGVTQDQEEFLSLIEGSSRNLIAIVNDVLDLSKINADKMEIESVSFDIYETIESTVATFTQQAVQKDIELGVFIDPFLSHYFMGDATKLSQILTNLISNAIKFTNPYGKINIIIQSLHHNENEAKIKFSVSDDGIGLSPEQIKNIFNPFTQATKSTSNRYGGTGLGLAISRKMVELMGGTLEVKSQLNKGASFYFTLKLDKDNSKTFEPYPHFKNISVGLALPVKSIRRQLDSNLKIYLEYLGAKFSIYYYEDLFADDVYVELPDVMIFDHHYARLSGELEQCSSLDCKTVILTNGSLHARINPNRHHFDDIIFTPISMHKCIRILQVTHNEDTEVYAKPSKTLENIESFTGLHALVADDNLINRKLIKIILEKTGLDVTLASDGQEAFNKYKEEKFDIIFMDIQMPIMDGIDATHKIIAYEKEKNLSHIPIIALTANVATGDKEHYLAEGMDDYATKPLEIDVLKLIISKHCSVSLTNND